MTKDRWDIAEIIFKIFAGVFIPLVVAFSVYLWNVEVSKRDTAAQMASIAVSILTTEPDKTNTGADPLRSWAIDVLRNPQDPPPLSQEAAQELEFRHLDFSRTFEDREKIQELAKEISKALRKGIEQENTAAQEP